MKTFPDIEAVIDRRLLLNFRVDPETAARLVPAPFRPSLSTGFAIAGVCLIRLTELRPHGFPLRSASRPKAPPIDSPSNGTPSTAPSTVSTSRAAIPTRA